MSRIAVIAVLAALSLPAAAQAVPNWNANVQRATAYAQSRSGTESFVVRDESGVRHGWNGARVYGSASVLKAMLLVAYLHRPSVRDRALTDDEKAKLEPMIRRSANEPASYFVNLMGAAPLNRLAMRAGMDHFRLHRPVWGLSEITARGQSRFFRKIDTLLPGRHRAYAMNLLNTIIPEQRWGIPPVKPPGWKIYFKGGWGSGTGLKTHQVALLRRGDSRRLSLAILTEGNPSHAYGIETIREIARRLLRGLD
ncbi:MAG: serine hydrolase [Acidobacteriota bacterium]